MKKHYPYVESFELANASDDIYEASLAIPYIGAAGSICYHEKCMRIFGERRELAERCKKVIDALAVEF